MEPSQVRDRALAAIAGLEPCDTSSLAETLSWSVGVTKEVVAILLRFERIEAQHAPAGLTGGYAHICLTDKVGCW
jgi:hypothetical protein